MVPSVVEVVAQAELLHVDDASFSTESQTIVSNSNTIFAAMPTYNPDDAGNLSKVSGRFETCHGPVEPPPQLHIIEAAEVAQNFLVDFNSHRARTDAVLRIPLC